MERDIDISITGPEYTYSPESTEIETKEEGEEKNQNPPEP